MTSKSALTALVLCLAACKNDPPPQTKEQAAPSSSSIPEDFVVNGFFQNNAGKLTVKVDGGVDFGEAAGADASDGGKLKVIEPGAEPRAMLAYNLALGKTSTITALVDTEVKGEDVPEGQGKQPPIKFTIALTPKKKLDAQKTQVELKVTKIDLGAAPPEVQKQIATLQASMSKITGTLNVTPSGQATDLALPGAEALPGGAGEQMRGLLERVKDLLVVPLPPAPVGVGGRWQSVSNIAEEGAAITSTFTYLAKNELGYEIKYETSTIIAGRTLRDQRSGRNVLLNVKGSAAYTLTVALDALTVKGSGQSTTDVVTQAQGEEKHLNGEKTTITIEKEAAPKK